MTFISKSSLYGLSTVCNIGMQLIMIPILLSFISIEDYGVVGLYLGLVALFSMLLPMSSENALARSVFEKNKDLNQQVFETAIATIFTISSLSLVIILSIKGLLTEPLYFIFLLALITSVLQAFVNLILVQLQMREKVVNYFFISVSQAILILLLTTYWLPTIGVWARYVSPIISLFVILFLYCALTNSKYVYFKPGIHGWYYIRKVGLPLAPHSLMNVSSMYIDRFFLKLFNHDVLLGFYTIASQLINAVGASLSSINNAYTPWLFKKLSKDKSLNFIGLSVILAIACFLLTLFLIWVVPFIPSGKYSVVLDSLYLIPIYIFFEGVYYLICPLLFYKKQGFSISAVTFFSAVSKVGFLLGYLIFFDPTIIGVLTILIVSVAIKTLMTIIVATKTMTQTQKKTFSA